MTDILLLLDKYLLCVNSALFCKYDRNSAVPAVFSQNTEGFIRCSTGGRGEIYALFVIEFIFMWSPYLWPLLVTNSADMRAIQIGLKMLLASGQIAPEWNIIMAVTIIAMILPLIVLIIFRKSFSKGIAMQTEK